MKRRKGRVQRHRTILRVPPVRPRHPLTEAELWPESLQAPPLPQAPPPAWGGPGKGHLALIPFCEQSVSMNLARELPTL